MAKLKPLNEILETDCCKLLLKQAFVANVLLSLKMEVNNDFKTAATDGEKIYINEKFYRSLTPGERIFVLAHETWHVILLHFARRQNRDPFYFNIATDLEIHFLLASDKFSEPFVLPHDPEWASLSAEQIYDLIAPRNGQILPGQFLAHHGSGRPGAKDAEPDKSSGADSKWKRSDDAAEGEGFDEHIYSSDAASVDRFDRVRENIRRALNRTGYSFGRLPAGVQVLLQDFLTPHVDWRTELKQFVTQCFGGSRRWLPPARRYVSQGLYLPSRRDTMLNAVVAIDTSGSTEQYLPEFFSELNGLLHSFGSYEITVIQCDAEIHKVEKFTGDIPSSFSAVGFGGTNFIPPFEYVRKNRLTPSVFIYITDGYGRAPEVPPPYPVLWLLTPDGIDYSLPWGRKIRIREQKGNI